MFHDTNQDASYLPEAYNKGDDWFEATLGEPMIYTGAIYTGPSTRARASAACRLPPRVAGTPHPTPRAHRARADLPAIAADAAPRPQRDNVERAAE